MKADLLLKKLALLTEAYPNFSPKPNTFILYLQSLADLDEEAIDRSLSICLNTCKFFPTIAEIRENAKIKGKGAAEAWVEVHKLASQYGADNMPEIEDANIKRAVEKIGWRNLCTKSELDAKLTFMKIYEEKDNMLLLKESV